MESTASSKTQSAGFLTNLLSQRRQLTEIESIVERIARNQRPVLTHWCMQRCASGIIYDNIENHEMVLLEATKLADR